MIKYNIGVDEETGEYLIGDVDSHVIFARGTDKDRMINLVRFANLGLDKVEPETVDVKKLVVHCKKAPFDVYIGRPSKWGNPFAIGQHGNREQVISQFKAYLNRSPMLMKDAQRELKGKVLGCYCSPEACHGHILAEYANKED